MLIDPLFIHAAQRPEELALIDDRGQCTYSQLATMAVGMSHVVASQTSLPSVGLLLPAGSGFVASFYGTLLAGKSAVLINYLLGDKEIAHVIADSGIDMVLTIPQLAGRVANAGLKVIDLTQLPAPDPNSMLAEAGTPKFPQVNKDDMAVLMYTSGTSGLPKGVILTYGNLQSDVDAAI